MPETSRAPRPLPPRSHSPPAPATFVTQSRSPPPASECTPPATQPTPANLTHHPQVQRVPHLRGAHFAALRWGRCRVPHPFAFLARGWDLSPDLSLLASLHSTARKSRARSPVPARLA